MIKVGRKYATYKDVKYDSDKWADASLYLPADFDICSLKTEAGFSKRGWHTGTQWDGAAITDKDKIKYWKLFNLNDHDMRKR